MSLAILLLSGFALGLAPHPIEEELAPAHRGGPGHAGHFPGELSAEKPAGVEAILFAATHPFPGGSERPPIPAALVAMNAEDGAVLWRRELTGRPTAPTVAGGLVLVGSDAGGVHAFDAATGTPRWSFKTKQGVLGQPVADEKTVYFGGGSDHKIHAVSLEKGKKVWVAGVKGEGVFSPVRVEDDSLYAFSATHHAAPVLYCFETKRGKCSWKEDKLEITPLTGPNDFELAGDLLVAGVTPNRYRKKSDRTEDGEPTNYLVGFARDDGEETWRVPTGPLRCYAPATAGEMVVCYAHGAVSDAKPGGAMLHLLAWKAGIDERLWSVELGRAPARWASTSPTIAQGLVYTASGTEVAAYDLETGEETWRMPARNAVLAVAGDRCYVAIAGGRLAAVDARTGSSRWRAELRPVEAPPPGPSCPGEIAPLAVAD